MKAVGNLNLKVKLLTAFLFASVIVLLISVVSITNMLDTIDKHSSIPDAIIYPLKQIAKANGDLENVRALSRGILIHGDSAKAVEEADAIRVSLADAKRAMQAFDDASPLYSGFMASVDIYSGYLGAFLDMALSGDVAGATSYLEETLSPKSGDLQRSLYALSEEKLDFGNDVAGATVAASRSSLTFLMIISGIGFMLTVAFGMYFSTSISRPILLGAETMTKAADGDFSVRLPDDYGAEIGRLFAACNSLNEYNNVNVIKIRESTADIRSAAEEMHNVSSKTAQNIASLNSQTSSVSAVTEEFSTGMAQSSNSLSTATAHIMAVASSIEETNATIGTIAAAAEETSTRVSQSSDLVESIKDSIAKASDSARMVARSFDSVAGSVDEINKSLALVGGQCTATKGRVSNADEKARNTNAAIQRLEAASKQIGKIVGVISDFADQTNMLALNAAIEAAGAGEVGKGFMVVANEVKELAKQTADASDEIAEQIENMQRSMPEAVGAVSEITVIISEMTEFITSFTQEISVQGQRSDRIAEDSMAAARMMGDITAEINRISDNAVSVTKTVVDSAKGTNEIAKSISELVVGAQDIAMNSERATNNIKEIDRAAKEMVSGLNEISKSVQLIDAEAGTVQGGADATKASSVTLLRTANDLEAMISKFKVR